jgi:hypothetical protein
MEEQKLEIVAISALELITKAEIDVQISTAKAFPRSIKQFIDKAMSIATVNENVAASCAYALPRGGKSLEGPSVRLAEIVASSYGNIRTGARVISNDGKIITAQGICHDLETNSSVTVEVQRRITGKDGKTFNEDMQVVTGNAACAIAFRNAVFKEIPFALVTDIYDAAKAVAKGTAATLPLRREKAVSYFKELGVKDKQICEVLGVKKIEDIDLDKLSILSGMRTAYKSNESTLEELFNPNGDISLEDLQLMYDNKKALLTPEDCANIERILKNKETQSYKKVLAILEK